MFFGFWARYEQRVFSGRLRVQPEFDENRAERKPIRFPQDKANVTCWQWVSAVQLALFWSFLFGGMSESRAGDNRCSNWSGETYAARTAGSRFVEYHGSAGRGALLWNTRRVHPARWSQGTSPGNKHPGVGDTSFDSSADWRARHQKEGIRLFLRDGTVRRTSER